MACEHKWRVTYGPTGAGYSEQRCALCGAEIVTASAEDATVIELVNLKLIVRAGSPTLGATLGRPPSDLG